MKKRVKHRKEVIELLNGCHRTEISVNPKNWESIQASTTMIGIFGIVLPIPCIRRGSPTANWR